MEPLGELAKYGTVGIAIALIAYTAWKDKMNNRTTIDFFRKMSEVILEGAKQNQRVATAVDNNTRVMERVERKLDTSK